MTSGLNATSWENKNNSLLLELKDKNNLLSDLQEKYQQMTTIYQEATKKNY
jgi:hypothetical protein